MSSVMEMFESTGAYLHGHFRLSSGMHSDEYLQCAKVLAVPDYAERLGQWLASKLKPVIDQVKPDAVVSPALGGIIIGHEVARSFGVLSLFTERGGDNHEMTLRRGFEIKPGWQVVVIEDVITTGTSTKEVIALIQSMGAKTLAVGSIIDRSGGKADVGVPCASLETLHPIVFQPESCHLCQQGVPIVKPGSRPD